ncbi:MAG: hypothetical protein QGG39_14540 [Candidatus Poribacteria bacterium]|jgi:hypothetical protein|nr:hypothetical protein [Candidatus Poribacteria bacterium]
MGAIVGTYVWGSKLTGEWTDEEEIVWLRNDLSAVAIDQLGQATDKH